MTTDSNKKVAVAQMVSTESPEQNMQQLEQLMVPLADQDVSLVVLPENFIAYGNPDYRSIARHEAEGGPDSYCSRLSKLAKQYGVWIVGGTIPLMDKDDERPWAACLVYDDQGELAGRYDKIHLFDANVKDAQASYRESNHYRPGNNIVVIDSPVGKLGLAVCYDLRFPELFTAMSEQGAEVIALPSAFTWITGQAHWQPLLQARAIENGCYVLASGQGGHHNEKRQTWGHSQIVDPWGTVVAEQAEEGPGLVISEIDADRIKSVRSSLPVFQHRQVRKQRLQW